MHSLIAATATGVPPRVPLVEIEGTSSVLSVAFDSAAFTNPTGVPMTTAGHVPSRIREQRAMSADGALPITTIYPGICSASAWIPAELRVIPCSRAIPAP